jgi:hypothetical protein
MGEEGYGVLAYNPGNPFSVYNMGEGSVAAQYNRGDTQGTAMNLLEIYDDIAKIVNEENIEQYSTGRGQLELRNILQGMADKYGIELSAIEGISDKVINDIELNPTDNKAERKSRMTAMFADWGLQAAKLGTSIWQIVKANKGLNDLQKPDFETRQKDMSEIDSLINDLKKKSQGEFPLRSREREREFADLMNRTQRTARQFGVQGAALQQAAYTEGSKAKRAGEMEDEGLKAQYAGMLSQLLSLKEGAEQFDAQQAQRQHLEADLPEYLSNVYSLGQAKQAGVENLFGTLEQVPYKTMGTMQMMQDYRDIRKQLKMDQLEEERAKTAAQEKERINQLAEIAEKESQPEEQQMDEMSIYSMGPLGVIRPTNPQTW